MTARKLPIGCCAGLAGLAVLQARQGLDFIELPVAKALIGGADEFEQLEAALQHSKLAARAVNVFLPATLKVVGPDVREDQLSHYASMALERARRLGVALLVFGSGASRMVPVGFSRDRALEQFADAVRLVKGRASRRSLTVAGEPLHAESTDILNRVAEARKFR